MKNIVKKVGEKKLAPGVKQSLKKCLPDSKIVMGRAKRGIFAGRHIQFGNSVSEDGGNKFVSSDLSLSLSLVYASGFSAQNLVSVLGISLLFFLMNKKLQFPFVVST